MNASSRVANSTQLVFCKENVNPDLVTRLLDLTPLKFRESWGSGRTRKWSSILLASWYLEIRFTQCHPRWPRRRSNRQVDWATPTKIESTMPIKRTGL